jgi:hypothetical protein
MNDEARTQSYEVALSFAGEDRPYVGEVVDRLKNLGITVFYDQDEQATLWGTDLYVYLDKVYRKATQYCVMFISKAYADKLWTNHERMSLQARDFVNAHDGTVLPARFDDTEIPGLRPQIGYVDLRSLSPRALADLIADKVRGRRKRVLDAALERSLELSRNYLLPQSLASSDSVAQEIRSAFGSTGYTPSAEFVEPYLQSQEASQRVVGYLAYQVAPYRGISGVLGNCLTNELEHALRTKETRPLWQLLVCLGLFGAVTDPEEMQFMALPLKEARKALQRQKDVDAGGECASKLTALMTIFPWMSGSGRYTRIREEHPWVFLWQSGDETYGLSSALEYVREYPERARFHIVSGHFSPWYSLSVPPDADVPDLMAAIARKIAAAENE